ncbi:zinc finger and BTB domain-containing protein 39-like [Petromyzon marinus]|uniref:zinc finger and BTB domain-containing protein 39-like n=1 Tax=Petromyzon marinus TaxID=7757 RepID=UPI003F72CB3D
MSEDTAENMEEMLELSSNNHVPDLLRELCELREKGSFCDVVVEVQSRRYLAHKALLSSTCRYFRSLFLDVPCSSMGPFLVDFLTMRTFELVVNFIYKGQIRASRKEMRGLCYAAVDLGMDCLAEACKPFNLVEDIENDMENDDCGSIEQGTQAFTEDLHGNDGQKDRTDVPAMPAIEDKAVLVNCSVSKHINMNNPIPLEDGCDKIRNASTMVGEIKIEPLESEGAAGGDENIEEAYREFDNLNIKFDGKVERVKEDSYVAKPIGYHQLNEPYTQFTDDIPMGIPCQVCDEFIGESDDCVRGHARSVHLDVAAMSCRICGKKFRLLNNAEQHVVLHMGVTALHCHDCRKQFYSEERLILHRAQSCGKKLKAPWQGGRLARADPAATGVRAASSSLPSLPPAPAPPQSAAPLAPGNSVVWCRTCGEMVFKSMTALRSHARTHVDTSSLLCNVCGQQSTFISNLIKHALLHVGVFLYECETCGKRFLMRCRLIVHQRGCRGSRAGAQASAVANSY